MDTVNRKLEDVVHELAFTNIEEIPENTFESNPLLGQLVALGSELWVDTGDLDETEVAELFGKTKGFKTDEPNVSADGTPCSVEDDDF